MQYKVRILCLWPTGRLAVEYRFPYCVRWINPLRELVCFCCIFLTTFLNSMLRLRSYWFMLVLLGTLYFLCTDRYDSKPVRHYVMYVCLYVTYVHYGCVRCWVPYASFFYCDAAAFLVSFCSPLLCLILPYYSPWFPVLGLCIILPTPVVVWCDAVCVFRHERMMRLGLALHYLGFTRFMPLGMDGWRSLISRRYCGMFHGILYAYICTVVSSDRIVCFLRLQCDS